MYFDPKSPDLFAELLIIEKKIKKCFSFTYHSFINKPDEWCSLDFNLISIPIEKLDHEMEKVWFSQVGRWLFCKIDSCKTTPGRK